LAYICSMIEKLIDGLSIERIVELIIPFVLSHYHTAA